MILTPTRTVFFLRQMQYGFLLIFCTVSVLAIWGKQFGWFEIAALFASAIALFFCGRFLLKQYEHTQTLRLSPNTVLFRRGKFWLRRTVLLPRQIVGIRLRRFLPIRRLNLWFVTLWTVQNTVSLFPLHTDQLAVLCSHLGFTPSEIMQ